MGTQDVKKPDVTTTVDVGVPGASLDREHARRLAAREARVRARHPRIGGLLLRLSSPSPSTQAFAVGAAGEREVAERLQRAVGESVLFLYNRRRGTAAERGDIDMLAVAPSGVWIIDPKKYAGREVRADKAVAPSWWTVAGGRSSPRACEPSWPLSPQPSGTAHAPSHP